MIPRAVCNQNFYGRREEYSSGEHGFKHYVKKDGKRVRALINCNEFVVKLTKTGKRYLKNKSDLEKVEQNRKDKGTVF